MAERGFFLGGHFGEGPVVAGRDENRVVAESAGPAWRVEQGSFACSGKGCLAFGADEGKDTHEARGPAFGRESAQFVEEFGEVGGIVGGFARVTRRVDAGRAVEGVHREAGVVRDRAMAAGRREGVPGLEQRVFGKGRPGFLGNRRGREGVQADDFERQSGQQLGEFPGFPRIVRGNDEG